MTPAMQDDQAAWVFEGSWTEPPRRRGPDRRVLVGTLAGVATVALVVGAAWTWSNSEHSASVKTAAKPSASAAATGAAGAKGSRAALPGASAVPAGSPAAGGAAAGSAAASRPALSPSAQPAVAAAMCPESAIAASVLPDTPSRSHRPWKGVSGATVAFTNVGTAACRLKGYPGVGFYNDDVEVTTRSGPGVLVAKQPSTTVVLQPGQAAYSEIRWWSEDTQTIGVQRVSLIAPDHRQQNFVPVNWDISLTQQQVDVGPLTATLDPAPGPGPTA